MIDKILNSYMIHDELGNHFVVDGEKLLYSDDPEHHYLKVVSEGKTVARFTNYSSFIKIATVIKSFTLQ